MTKKPHITFFEKLSNATYPELFSLWMLVNVICTIFYFVLATLHSSNSPSLLPEMDIGRRLFNSFYFSIITATSLGYGDIIPHGFSKILVMAQSIIELLIFALFVTKLVSRRQDTTMEEEHRMTSESIFYNIRQGLFLVRKDFDSLIHEIEHTKHLTEQEWEILTTAYLQAQNLIEEIPNLYNGQGHDLYIIDVKREKLLLEAIYRTIRRTEKFLDCMEKHGVDWKKHPSSMEEFQELVRVLHNIMPLWREKSPSEERIETFDEIVKMSEGLLERIR